LELGLAKMPASRAGVFLNLEPVAGTCPGLIILHETLGLTALIGGMIIHPAIGSVHQLPDGVFAEGITDRAVLLLDRPLNQPPVS
jgi:threonine/homoserine efflux transporter RhtA